MKRRLEFSYPPRKRFHHDRDERRPAPSDQNEELTADFSQEPKRVPPPKNLAASLFAALRENNRDSLCRFIESIPKKLSFIEIVILISSLSRAAHTHTNAFKAHKDLCSQLLHQIGGDFNQLLPRSREEFQTLIFQENLDLNKMGLLFYSLGNLIREGLETPVFHTKRIELFLNFIFLEGKGPINFIGSCLYGLGQLAEKERITEAFQAAFLKKLLSKYLELATLSRQAISTTMIGLGSIVKAKQLTGKLDLKLLNDFIKRLLQASDLDLLAFGDCFLNLSTLAKNKKLEGKILAPAVDACFWKFLEIKTLRPQNQIHYLQKFLLGLSFLAKMGHIEGRLEIKHIESLLKQVQDCLTSERPLNDHQRENISLIFFALGSMKEASCFKTPFSPETLSIFQNLLKKFEISCITEKEAHQLLTGLSSFKIPVSEEILKQLFNSLLSCSYIHPVQALDLLHKLSGFKEHLPRFEKEFSNIIEALLPLDCYNSRNQALLEKIRDELNFLPHWRRELDLILNLKHQKEPIELTHQGSIKTFASIPEATRLKTIDLDNQQSKEQVSATHQSTAIPAAVQEKLPTKMQKKPREASSQSKVPTSLGRRIEPSRIHASPTQVEELPFFHNPRSQLTKKEWGAACQNKIFFSIDKKDVTGLQRLLELKELAPSPKSHKIAHTPKSRRRRPFFNEAIDNDVKEKIESTIIAFFSRTDARALRILIESSEPIYFFLLFKALSVHQRLEQAKLHRFHPVLLYLPAKHLKEMINLMLSPLQFQRDHEALLNLIEALSIREKKFKANKTLLESLQAQLFTVGFHYHESRHCHGVIETLTHVQEEYLAKGKSILFHELFETIEKPRSHPRPLASQPQEKTQRLATPPPTLVINNHYLYEVEDIQAILAARMTPYPEVHVLASAQMNESLEGNKPSDVLGQTLAENPELLGTRDPKILLLPIQRRGHWIGLRIDLAVGRILLISYFNSLRGNHQIEIDMLQENLSNAGLISPDFKIEENKTALKQPDASGCGPLLIENFYSSRKGKGWVRAGSTVSPEDLRKIRKRHLVVLETAALESKRPELYAVFYNKQRLGLNTVPELREQARTHGLSSLSLFSPKDRTPESHGISEPHQQRKGI